MKKLILSSILITSIFNICFAAESFGGIRRFLEDITDNIVATAGYLFMTMGVVAFMWGIVEFIWAQRSGEKEGTKAGKSMMTWGILALFVMFSIYGIINFMQKTVGNDFQQKNIVVPRFQINGNSGSDPFQSLWNSGSGSCAGDSVCGTGFVCNNSTKRCEK